ncbi:uncharacterized protein B4U79_13661 [Dinothrombium tinctorium]|uniref:TNFR-Cys domain-containing protein n=1 Tax=Dinothrombium tinctorium TaxID=1965070 RepID=A0A3S3P9X9_9ACAR|nr:uncharacterized protein B4U79_13661 [Dinothrombium tinctorium]
MNLILFSFFVFNIDLKISCSELKPTNTEESSFRLPTLFDALNRRNHKHRTRHHHHLLLSQNIRCNPCPPGFRAIKECNIKNDHCVPCPAGTYSMHSSYKNYCDICSLCGEGLYVAHECTPTKDTFCDSLHNLADGISANSRMRVSATRDCFTYNWAKSLHLTDETVSTLISNGFKTKAQLLMLNETIETIQFPNEVDKAAVTAALKILSKENCNITIKMNHPNEANANHPANGVSTDESATIAVEQRESGQRESDVTDNVVKKDDEKSAKNDESNREESSPEEDITRKFLLKLFFTISLTHGMTLAIM